MKKVGEKMKLDVNKSYYLVDQHSGKGLSYEVYSNYDYVREVDGNGTKIKFEDAGNASYRIKMTSSHWDNYTYFTRSGKNWIYLDTKEKSSTWHVSDTTSFFGISSSDAACVYQSGQLDPHYWTYFEKGSKKWLGTDGTNEAKRFKFVEVE